MQDKKTLSELQKRPSYKWDFAKNTAGKKLVLVNNESKKVMYLSPMVSGKTHDKKMADAKIPLVTRLGLQ